MPLLHNLNSGTKHFPLLSQRPFHIKVCPIVNRSRTVMPSKQTSAQWLDYNTNNKKCFICKFSVYNFFSFLKTVHLCLLCEASYMMAFLIIFDGITCSARSSVCGTLLYSLNEYQVKELSRNLILVNFYFQSCHGVRWRVKKKLLLPLFPHYYSVFRLLHLL